VITVALAACGRVGFDAVSRDGGDDDGPDAVDAPFGQTCASRPVGMVPPSGRVSGTQSTEPADAVGGCGGGGFNDAVFGIDVPDAESSLLVATDLPGSSSNTLIHIRRDCDDPSTEVVCDVSGGVNEDAAYRLITPGAGRYFVFIDQEAGGTGASFEASIQVLRGAGAACTTTGREICTPELRCVAGICQPAGCVMVNALTISSLGTTNRTVSTAGLMGDHGGTCGEGNDGGARAPDEVVPFDLQLSARLEIRTDNPGTNYDTLLYLRATCAGPEIACNDDGVGTGPSRFVTGVLTPGQYLLFVDGFAFKQGTADISIRAF